jgi:hypothetical protein
MCRSRVETVTLRRGPSVGVGHTCGVQYFFGASTVVSVKQLGLRWRPFELFKELASRRKDTAMPDRPNTLPLSCPHCNATIAQIAALSYSVITLTCTGCGHGWSLRMESLPDYVLAMLGRAA